MSDKPEDNFSNWIQELEEDNEQLASNIWPPFWWGVIIAVLVLIIVLLVLL